MRIYLSALVAALGFSAFAGAALAANSAGAVLSATVINPGAPYPECHASTIVELAPGRLAAAWFGGTKERNPDVGIWVTRQLEGKWTEPIEVANGVQHLKADGTPLRHPCWNPVLFQVPNGQLLLFYKCGPDPKTWWGMLTESADNGETWDNPHRLPEGILGEEHIELPHLRSAVKLRKQVVALEVERRDP